MVTFRMRFGPKIRLSHRSLSRNMQAAAEMDELAKEFREKKHPPDISWILDL